MTYTFAELTVSPETFAEIAEALKAAGYDHAFHEGRIDMNGIALVRRAVEEYPTPHPETDKIVGEPTE